MGAVLCALPRVGRLIRVLCLVCCVWCAVSDVRCLCLATHRQADPCMTHDPCRLIRAGYGALPIHCRERRYPAGAGPSQRSADPAADRPDDKKKTIKRREKKASISTRQTQKHQHEHNTNTNKNMSG